MKNIKALVGGLALAAIVGVNGYMAMADTASSHELDVTNVERLADGWEWSDLGFGTNWREDFVIINCDNFDYDWTYIENLNFGVFTVQLGKKGGTKKVRQCNSGGGDCGVSQSTNCNDC